MNFTLSQHATTATKERGIEHEWIRRTLDAPELVQPHESDPSLQYAFRRIPEFGNRVLRVVYNPSTTPHHVITVYFDRTMKDAL